MFSKLRLNFPIIVATLLALSLFFATLVTAQFLPDVYETQDAAVNDQGLENWNLNSINSTANAAQIFLSGTVPPAGTTGWIPGGAIGNVNGMIASLYTPAASGVEYLAQIKDNFLGRPAYAQNGGGFRGLQPILPLWRGFRNATYIISTVFFVIIGILIMLRIKISAQAVITIQSAIPQVITTLILVTFSYAIAGLLIDIMNLFQSFAIALLFSATGKNLTDSIVQPNLLSQLTNWIGWGQNAFSFADLTTRNGFLQTWMLIDRIVPVAAFLIPAGLIGAILGGILTAGTGPGIVGGILFGATAISVIVLLIIEIVIIANLIKLLFGLIKAYIAIVVKIILGPLEIGMGAFPNSKMGFSSWIWDLIANLSVFPFVMLFLIFLNIIVDNIGGGLWTPGLLGAAGPVTGAIVGALVGLGGLVLVAKLPEMIPQFVFMIKPSPWGQAIGQGLTENSARLTSPVKFGYNTGVDLAAGGIATGVGPFAGINRELEGLSPDQQVPKQASEIVRGVLKRR